VRALFEGVEWGHGALDVLVNNATGHHQDHIGAEPFWEQPLSHWEGMFERGVGTTSSPAGRPRRSSCGSAAG
jgi:NAD(P)-dependent dehydrogenase (short-subunit alcohol dehydrogenase family)